MRLLVAAALLLTTQLGLARAEEARPSEGSPDTEVDATRPRLSKVPPKHPWVSQIHIGAGVDNNIDMSPFGSDPSALMGFNLVSQYQASKNLRIALQGDYQKNLPNTTAGDGGAALFAGYLRDLPAHLQLRLSGYVEGRQERSVFADGAILTTTTAVQKIVESNVAGLLAYRFGPMDIEAGVQSNFEAHDGNLQSSQLFGVHAVAGLRYSYRDRVTLRLRYTYELSRTNGLSSRNLNGGIVGQDNTLVIGVNRARVSMRTRLSDVSTLFARYDYVTATDDFSGYLDSREHVGFVSTAVNWGSFGLDASSEVAHRFFFLRTASPDNPDTDTTYSGVIRVNAWVLPTFANVKRIGLFALYKAQVVNANPTGLVFARHIGMSGISGHFGSGS